MLMIFVGVDIHEPASNETCDREERGRTISLATKGIDISDDSSGEFCDGSSGGSSGDD